MELLQKSSTKKDTNAAQAHKQKYAIYGEDALSEEITWKWFHPFRSGNFDVKIIFEVNDQIQIKSMRLLWYREGNKHPPLDSFKPFKDDWVQKKKA